jgi:excisionase family DNA binding protein
MTSRSLLEPGEVAEILGVSPQTLATWRATGRYDLPFVKIGRLCKYRQEDVQEFIDGNLSDDSEDDDDDEDEDDEE